MYQEHTLVGLFRSAILINLLCFYLFNNMLNEVESDEERKSVSARADTAEDAVDDMEEDGDDDEEEPYRDPPAGMIRIRPSKFNFIPGTIFIEYPPELGIPFCVNKMYYCVISVHRDNKARYKQAGKAWPQEIALHLLLGKELHQECLSVGL